MEPTTLQEKQPKENKNMNSIKNTRRWVLVEDYPAKAEYLISYIMQTHPSDEIYWIFPDSTTYNRPSYVKSLEKKDSLKPFKMPLILEKGKIEVVEGKVHFFWCKNREDFSELYEDIVRDDNSILLLDVELKGLGKTGPDTDFVAPKAKRMLGSQGRKCLVTIMSRVANFMEVKSRIDPEDDRILALGGRWQFIYSSLPKDCREVVQESHKLWQKLFEKNEFNLDVFLEEMAKLSQHECHNWQNELSKNRQYYIETGRWHEEWDMPIQLSYLIKLLNYKPDQFIEDLDLKKNNGYFQEGSPTCHALKLMGTKDKDTHSFSILGAAFIAWAAYRDLFPNGDGNALFLNAIRQASERMARHQFITPPQQLPTLQRTIRQLFQLLRTVFISTEADPKQLDNLMEVELEDSGLSFCLNINPESLHQALTQEYRKRLLNAKEIGGGTSSKKIIDYLAQSNYCDRLLMDQKPLIGATYGLKIFAAGEENINGTILKFGNEI